MSSFSTQIVGVAFRILNSARNWRLPEHADHTQTGEIRPRPYFEVSIGQEKRAQKARLRRIKQVSQSNKHTRLSCCTYCFSCLDESDVVVDRGKVQERIPSDVGPSQRYSTNRLIRKIHRKTKCKQRSGRIGSFVRRVARNRSFNQPLMHTSTL